MCKINPDLGCHGNKVAVSRGGAEGKKSFVFLLLPVAPRVKGVYKLTLYSAIVLPAYIMSRNHQ